MSQNGVTGGAQTVGDHADFPNSPQGALPGAPEL
jgi:hypothetical protein